MSLFWNDLAAINSTFAGGAPRMLPFESNAKDDEEFARITDIFRDDMLGELRHESLAEIITQEYELHETDLYAKLLTAAAVWDGKPETAYARMKAIDRLIHKAIDKIAEKKARDELDL